MAKNSRGVFGLQFAGLVYIFLMAASLYAQANKTCLDRAYPKGEVPNSEDAAFDAAYDTLNKNSWSLSCGPEIAASQGRNALESFRYGVLYNDQAHLDSVLHYPLPVRIRKSLETTENPRLVTVHNFKEWSKLQSAELGATHLTAIACAWLGNVTAANGRSPGFFISDGMVWFQRLVGSSKVWVTSLNLMPLTPEMLADSCAPGHH